MKIIVLPINGLRKIFQEKLSKRLEKTYQNIVKKVRLGKKIKIPKNSYNPDRKQYNAKAFLDHLDSKTKNDENKILGITEKDLYARGLNFVFGQAQAPGKYAIISTHRLKPEFYNKEKNRNLLEERIVKESIHELGHVFGLNHCEDSKCVMSFSNSINHVDRKNPDFCKKCRKKLLQAT